MSGERKMASPKGPDASDSDITFPEADADRELNFGQNVHYEVDPISSEVATSLEIKEEIEAEEKRKSKEEEKKIEEAFTTLKKTIIISGIVVALAGAVFAITKKMKEK